MKNKKKFGIILLCIIILATMIQTGFYSGTAKAEPVSFVGYHGQLKVQGNRIVDARGKAITLHGMSMYPWASQGLQYYNATAVERLVKEWKCTVLRIPILPKDVGSQESLVRKVVDACIANGIYAIIDWHSMGGANASACSDFMKRMATSYGNTPNVMYETWNEPVNETWPTIKAYHQQVISAIRSIDPDNIIICGTPQWDQSPQIAASDPITTSTNIAYTVHFYASTHKQWLRDNTTKALNKGIAIFSTEYGTGGADGNGTMDTASTQEWWSFLDANGVGCTNWSVCAISETTAAFNPGTSATTWTDSNLKPSGRLVKDYIVKMNTPLWNDITISSPSPTTNPSPTPTTKPSPTSTPIPSFDNSGNLAFGKTANSDSEESANGNIAAKANDGDINTRWCAADGELNHWWKVDLGTNSSITGTEVMWEHNGNVYKYKIEVSSDNSSWTTAVDKTNNTDTNQTQRNNFTANNIRYVRITITGLDTDTWASINELRVFGKSGITPVGPDVNHDGAVNMSDVIILAGVFNAARGEERYVAAYDLNSDGTINMTDLIIIAAKFNTTVSQ